MANQFEDRFRRRISQPSGTTYTRLVTANWGAMNPQTIAANNNRMVCTIQLEIPDGGTIRVATGGEAASATNGILLDASNGPTVQLTENISAISIYAVNGTESVTVQDETIVDGTLE